MVNKQKHVVVFVGLEPDLHVIASTRLPRDITYIYCSRVEEAPQTSRADEVVYVASHFNKVSSHLILLLEAIEREQPPGKQWLFRLDRSEISEVHTQLQGLPDGPPWLEEAMSGVE